MINIGFICVHNSCRSQMAQAICNLKYSHMFDAFSGGTELAASINKDAARLILKHYNFDMSLHQVPKLVGDLPALDIVITMGCNVACPWLDSSFQEDWGLDDPSGLDDSFFLSVMSEIEAKLIALIDRIETGIIDLR